MKINDRVYGEQTIDNKMIEEIIKTKEMQRLKGIHQHGTWHMVKNKFSYKNWTFPGYDFSRFEHSLGVYFLLRMFNASTEEQIAGLIHDVSHFTFSHVIDYVFGESHRQEFAEKFQDKLIRNSSMDAILIKNSIDVDAILEKSNFKMLEKDLPDICADRLDYLFRDSLVFYLTDKKLINRLIKSLTINDDEFIFSNGLSARQAARLYLESSKSMWTNPYQSASYQILSIALKAALDKGLIEEKDFYLTDDFLLKKVLNSGNKDVLEMMSLLKNLNVKEGTRDDYDFCVIVKARCIDPKFLDGDSIKRVSDIDEKFKRDIKQFQEWVKEGFYIKIIR